MRGFRDMFKAFSGSLEWKPPTTLIVNKFPFCAKLLSES